MRIAGVEIIDHPGFGDLTLDFRGADGTAPRLVVIAGENGSGKTVILETIFSALAPTSIISNKGNLNNSGKYRVFIEQDQISHASFGLQSVSPEEFSHFKTHWPGFNGLVVEISNEPKLGVPPGHERGYHTYYRIFDNTKTRGAVDSESIFGKKLTTFFSEANVSFAVPPVRTIQTSAGLNEPLDYNRIQTKIRGGAALASEIAQLLVDLQSADYADAGRWLTENQDRPPDELLNRRVKTFSEAFSRVVAGKRYVGFETSGGEHRPMFEHGRFRTPLSELSTGEKQIIFRAAFLLKEIENLPGSVVLIDEPELSLHPKWQDGILDFYDGLVKEETERKSQIIVATHSPFVVHGSPAAKHIVLRRNSETGTILEDKAPRYPGITTSELAVAAFDLTEIQFLSSPKPLAILVEGPTDKQIIECAWAQLRHKSLPPFVLIPVGGAKPMQNLIGSGQANGPIINALSQLGTNKIIGLWDFDKEGIDQWNGTVKINESEENNNSARSVFYRKKRNSNVWAALLPIPSYREDYASLEKRIVPPHLTIELLFEDRFIETILTRVPLSGAGGPSHLIATSDSQKQAVAAAVQQFPEEAFGSFLPLFEFFERVAAGGQSCS